MSADFRQEGSEEKKEPDAKLSVRLGPPTCKGPRARRGVLTKRLLVSQNSPVKNDAGVEMHADKNWIGCTVYN